MLHPYNPAKVFCHHKTWESVARWVSDRCSKDDSAWLPAPITVSVDPANICNCKCLNCNADFILEQDKRCMMSKEYLEKLADFLFDWQVRGVCLGGGGESLCNPYTGKFIHDLKYNDIGIGMVSNGILLDRVPELKELNWLGISMDSGTPEVWGLVHGASPKLFDRVVKGMTDLVSQDVDVTYKYLARPENVQDVYKGVEMAKLIGCRNFHIRPAAPPWFDNEKKNLFKPEQVDSVIEQLEAARKDFPEVNVIGIFNKLGANNWRIVHPFRNCWAIFVTCVFQANGKIGFCCDNRGNDHFEIGPFDDPRKLLDFWGSSKHFKMQCGKCFESCPRCTFKVFNEYFEKCVLDDDFMLSFI